MSALNSLDDKTFDSFAKEVYRRTGIHLDESKQTMLLARMRRRARSAGYPTYEEYLKSVEAAEDGSPEVDAFVDAVTTNKTSFFRTPSVWKYLFEEHLPNLATRPQAYRWWSAACSSGEEAASIAILCEAFRTGHRMDFHYEVVASDISPAMVQAASEQTFQAARASAIVSPTGVDASRFLLVRSEAATLDPSIKRRMSFRRHNLFQRLRGQRFDVVFLRNVIIYFTAEDKTRVLDHVIDTVVPNGLLVTGEAESPLQHTDRLEFVGACLYRRVR